jgi:isopentenyl-diphosphate delta-isomerase
MYQRKTDHIKMAASSAPIHSESDQRFDYEPMLSAHPQDLAPVNFLGKTMKHPLWISSMTGGLTEAHHINHLLAEACAEFGLGMGLGSCRTLLNSDDFFDDFNLRPIIGNDLPLYANLGIAQIEKLLVKNESERIHHLVHQLRADGLFIHVNPTQEWLQPEGDLLKRPAIETIAELTEIVNGNYKLLVKEVGQGMGPESLKQLLQLKIDGLEFAAFGGTNFANIEIMRNQQGHAQFMHPLGTFGHTTGQMLEMVNNITSEQKIHCQQIIVSGGIKNFLDGYYYTQKSVLPAIYGMAGVVLQHALISKQNLFDFLKAEVEGYQFASSFLKIKDEVKRT